MLLSLPLCQALSALSEATFRDELRRFFPVLTRLIMCEHTTADVQRALSEVFLTRVGPLLAASNGSDMQGLTPVGAVSAAAPAAAAAMPAMAVASAAATPPPPAAVFGDSLL